MEILILSIYSETDEYREMLEIQRAYVTQYPCVHYYFITFRKFQDNDVEIENDMIYLKGTESLLNITDKTIRTLEYLLPRIKVDFIIRTNISTIVDIPKLYGYCTKLPKTNVYTGDSDTLKCIDPIIGITDSTFFGTEFVIGCNLIMSCDIALFMLYRKLELHYDIVDDIAFAIFIKRYFPNAFIKDPNFMLFVPYDLTIDSLVNIGLKPIFFRNKVCETYKNITDRKMDIKNMRTICNYIYS